MYRSTHRAFCLSEKLYQKAVTFVKANGRVSAIPTYGVYRLSDTRVKH